MTRRQLGAAVREEAVITALMGTSTGIRLGTLIGWTVVRALEDKGFDTVTLPVAPLAVSAVAGAIAGGLIATLPACRAARLNLRHFTVGVLVAVAILLRNIPEEFVMAPPAAMARR